MCSLLLLSASCKKEKSKNPIDDLPPATQTGANTFGCLVNGKAFLPKGSGLGGPILLTQYVYDNGIYTLYISAFNKINNNHKTISIEIKNIVLSNNTINILNNDSIKRGEYYTINSSLIDSYKTNSTNTGKLIVTYWDYNKGIISGTFSFDAVNATGEKVEIREGRFDVKL